MDSIAGDRSSDSWRKGCSTDRETSVGGATSAADGLAGSFRADAVRLFSNSHAMQVGGTQAAAHLVSAFSLTDAARLATILPRHVHSAGEAVAAAGRLPGLPLRPDATELFSNNVARQTGVVGALAATRRVLASPMADAARLSVVLRRHVHGVGDAPAAAGRLPQLPLDSGAARLFSNSLARQLDVGSALAAARRVSASSGAEAARLSVALRQHVRGVGDAVAAAGRLPQLPLGSGAARLFSNNIARQLDVGNALAAATTLARSISSGVGALWAEVARGRACRELGWLPHHTMPELDYSALDKATAKELVLTHYAVHWPQVRRRIERRLAAYLIDDETKGSFVEALNAYEAGFFRCTCLLLLTVVERALRERFFSGEVRTVRHRQLVQRAVRAEESGEISFMVWGLRGMAMYEYFRDSSTSSGGRSDTIGLYSQVNARTLASLKASPIPTRHAAMHGWIGYDSRQSSLNAIFFADYICAAISR